MSGYNDTIRQWAIDTRRTGFLTDADGTGEVGLAADQAGSRLAVRFTLKTKGDRVADIRYQVFGCGFTMAACAVTAKMAVGCSFDDLATIDRQRIAQALDGLPTDRSYCADLAIEALHAAVRSARNGYQTVHAHLPEENPHRPRVIASDPLYKKLVDSPHPKGISGLDRHLFACLLTVATREPCDTARALDLAESDLSMIFEIVFPGLATTCLAEYAAASADDERPAINPDILALLREHIPTDRSRSHRLISAWLCHILAARAAHPGHLWVAMGLFERPELSAAIRRHLPTLSEANTGNMRWKRFLYKEVCERQGGTLCKAPNCGECSDYVLCFAGEE